MHTQSENSWISPPLIDCGRQARHAYRETFCKQHNELVALSVWSKAYTRFAIGRFATLRSHTSNKDLDYVCILFMINQHFSRTIDSSK